MATFNNKLMPPMADNYRLMENYYPSYNYTSMPQTPLPFHNVNPFMHQTFPQVLPFNPPSQPSHNADLNNFLRNRDASSFNVPTQQAFQTETENKQFDDPMTFSKATLPSTSNIQPVLPTRTKKKAGKPVPEEKKDKSYWDKRNKNNRSAKRSRESRRNRGKIVAGEIVVKTNQLEMMRMKLRSLMEEERRLRIMYSERGLQCPY